MKVKSYSKEHEALFNYWKAKMLADNIPINPNAHYIGDIDSCRTYGQCYCKVQIKLNKHLPDETIGETIVHELIHTVKDSEGHDKTFKYWASIANKKYNMNIGTYASNNEIEAFRKIVKPLYKTTCSNCGANTGVYYRASKIIKHPENYRSNCCKANIIVSKY